MGNASKTWLLGLDRQIWILAAGRLLSQIGTGFTAFYAPIFFVNQVGLSATQVGLALGSASVSGVVGRFLGGTGADNPAWGRKKTLLAAAGVSAIADVALATADTFWLLVLGNLLMGLGIGLYWPATETVVADLTSGSQRNEAFALVRLADNIGLGTGVMLGGLIIATIQNYRLLFVLDGVSFVVFFGVIWVAIAETYQSHEDVKAEGNSWLTALQDQRLVIYMAVNVMFTLYIAQIQSTAPLYLTNFIEFSPQVISGLFAWHIVFASVCQLPIARRLNGLSRPHALMVSLLLWGIGFTVMWGAGMGAIPALVGAIASLGILALATDAYTPAASALVVDLAPASQRGVYLALNSQCWAIGYLIGPPIGGWALDQVPAIAHGFWLAGAVSIVPCLLTLRYLETLITHKKTEG
ncbi:MDR family MFS transporter [Picosynechococcus sp. PCC 73109]|uniref:MDR family MFS transporter n=1 Tax=Picosynechococcus sp. PCC 73109 TaxID=374982 RepID=UPI0007458BF6|nr:MFS transporter [Picosynechococcus sp. PCC 73109]AMA08336.1 MFS transporter [Picosynechococcus sp. PCC 73109]